MSAGGKMTVTEESELFQKRTWSSSHPIEPPATQFHDMLHLRAHLVAHKLTRFCFELLALRFCCPVAQLAAQSHDFLGFFGTLRIGLGPGRIRCSVRHVLVIDK